MRFDTTNREPGIYFGQRKAVRPEIKSDAPSTQVFAGKAEWGPLEPTDIYGINEFISIFGKMEPSFTQVSKYFENGGSHIVFKRMVHYEDISNPSTTTAKRAMVRLLDGTPDPAEIGVITPDLNNAAPVDTLTYKEGDYIGILNGVYTLAITTGGAVGTAEYTVTFLEDGETTPTTVTPATVIADASTDIIIEGITVTLADGATDGFSENDKWTFTVKAEGGNLDAETRLYCYGRYAGDRALQVMVEPSTSGIAGTFKLTVLEDTVSKEVYDNVNLDIESKKYVVKVVNETLKSLIWLEDTDNVQELQTSVGLTYTLTGGNDGSEGLTENDYIGDEDLQIGIKALAAFDTPFDVYIPDLDYNANLFKQIYPKLITYAENQADPKLWFFIISVPEDLAFDEPNAVKNYVNDTLMLDTKRAMVAWPWLIDASTNEPISPAGGIMGTFSRVDATYGQATPAAGDVAPLLGYSGVVYNPSSKQAGILNTNNINVIRFYPGLGYCLNGARTLSKSDVAYLYFSTVRNTDLITYLLVQAVQYSKLKLKKPNLGASLMYVCGKILKSFRDDRMIIEDYSLELDTEQAGVSKILVGLKHFEVNEFTYISVGELADGTINLF